MPNPPVALICYKCCTRITLCESYRHVDLCDSCAATHDDLAFPRKLGQHIAISILLWAGAIGLVGVLVLCVQSLLSP